MATQILPEQLQSIERNKNLGIGMSGLFTILLQHTAGKNERYTALGQLTSSDLVSINNQASNVKAASLNGLRVIGDLASSFDPGAGVFDHVGHGWLVNHLTEAVEEMEALQYSASSELAVRGYDSSGTPLGSKRALEEASA